jgi:hypothetical protein
MTMVVGCRFRRSLGHPGKNILQTTHWRIFEPVAESPGDLGRKIPGKAMMSAANAPFIWLVRLKKSRFSRAAACPASLDVAGPFAYTSARS